MIPVRNPEGKIQGIQVRRDNLTKRKFRWISSVGKTDGTPAEGWTHLSGRFVDLLKRIENQTADCASTVAPIMV